MIKKFLILAFLLSFCSLSYADIFIDNNTSGCSNGSTNYAPGTRSCGAGSDTIYTSWANAVSGVSAGTEETPTVINIRSGTTYTMSARVIISKAWTTWQKYPSDGSKPIFDWNWAWDDVWRWTGMVQFAANSITVDGLEIKNAGYKEGTACYYAAAIQSGYGGTPSAAYDGHTIKNCYIHHVGWPGINLYRSDDVTIEDNELYECEYSPQEEGGGCWSGGIATAYGCDNVIIRGNIIHGIGGEGMNLNRSGSNYLIEDNIVYDTLSAAIFINGMHEVICRNNVVYDTEDARYMDMADGIAVASEDFGYSYPTFSRAENVHVYGNMVANMRPNIGIWAVCVDTGYFVKDIYLWNNTSIEVQTDYYDSRAFFVQAQYRNNYTSPIESNVVSMNNLLWQDSTGAIVGYDNHLDDITWSYNLWSKAPSSDAQDSTDPRYSSYGSMDMSDYFTKSPASAWNTLTGGGLSSSNFNLLPTAQYAIDQGTWPSFLKITAVNGNQITVGTDGAYAFYVGDTVYCSDGVTTAVIVSRDTHNSFTVNSSNGFSVDEYAMPFDVNGNAPDIGAYETGSTGETVFVPGSGSPSGAIACTSTATMTVQTETAATVKFDTSDVSYASMSYTMSTTGGTSHSHGLTGLSCNSSNTYYLRAADSTSSYIISFTIDPFQTNLINSNTYIQGSDTNTYDACYDRPYLWDGSTESGICYSTTGGAGITTMNLNFLFAQNKDITDVDAFGDASGSWTCSTWTVKYATNCSDPISWTTLFADADCYKNVWDEHAVEVTARCFRFEFTGTSLQVREIRVFGTNSEGGGPGGGSSNAVGAAFNNLGVGSSYNSNGVGMIP